MFYDDLPVSTLNNQKISFSGFCIDSRSQAPFCSFDRLTAVSSLFTRGSWRDRWQNRKIPVVSCHITFVWGSNSWPSKNWIPFCTKQKKSIVFNQLWFAQKWFPIDSYIGFPWKLDELWLRCVSPNPDPAASRPLHWPSGDDFSNLKNLSFLAELTLWWLNSRICGPFI